MKLCQQKKRTTIAGNNLPASLFPINELILTALFWSYTPRGAHRNCILCSMIHMWKERFVLEVEWRDEMAFPIS
jgi:hypothetical protein